MSSPLNLFRTFLGAEAGGTGPEFTLIAMLVGLALSGVLYVVGGVLTQEFEAVADALKRQNR